jgi:hypothetical protein
MVSRHKLVGDGSLLAIVPATVLTVVCYALSGCGLTDRNQSSDPAPDAGPDAEPDAGPDAEPDAGPDAEPDATQDPMQTSTRSTPVWSGRRSPSARRTAGTRWRR